MFGTIIIIIVFTLLSGFGDAQGFFHGSRVWANGKFISTEAIKSILGYIFGTVMFWIAIKYIYDVKAVSAEVQTIGWFIVTIIGIAILSGKFLQWQIIDQIIAVLIIIGVGWLLFRTGG